MAKKKSQGPKKRPKGNQGAPKASGGRQDLPDRRALEGIMFQAIGGMHAGHEDSPLARAQDLVYQAFDSPDPARRVKLAEKALEISPDCADAYVLLAEHANQRSEALELYAKGTAAGERALGPEAFREGVGHFWLMPETRPYMRARHGLAERCWDLGRRDEAIAHLRDMLRLNPNDNQGLRYILAQWLLVEGRDDELRTLLDQYDDATAFWTYTQALAAFRKDGDTAAARALLDAAKRGNPTVPTYLLQKKKRPMRPPASYSIGSPEEAMLYADQYLGAWKETPGALAWLEGPEPVKTPKRKSATAQLKGPQPQAIKRLEKLRSTADVWQADVVKFAKRVEHEGKGVYPWMILVGSRTHGQIKAEAMTFETPTAAMLWDVVAKAMSKPSMGKPHRPTEIQVRAESTWGELQSYFQTLEIDLVTVDELDFITFLTEEIEKAITENDQPSLLDVPGVEPAHLAGFYHAAAEFYRGAPWRKIGFEAAIRVACDKFDSSPWYGVVMGQAGMMIGLALYDDLKVLDNIRFGRGSERKNARDTVALTVSFDVQADISDADLDLIEDYGFEVAGEQAYPSIFRKERGMSMRPPLAWEIELMEGVLRSVPRFVSKYRPDDVAPHRFTVPTASGELTLELAWIDS